MNILIADKLSVEGLDLLEREGHHVSNQPGLSGDSLKEAIEQGGSDVLVVRSTRVTEDIIKSAHGLELIVRAGAGTDNIDVAAASQRGIFVANCPGKNADAVAELTIALLFSLDRSVPDNVMAARNGRWNKARYGKAAGLKGRTLGIVGLGSIGKAVAMRARALEMDVVAWSRSLTEHVAETLGVRRADSPLDVARQSDAVTLHVAATADTEGLADEAFFDAMKPGAFFINTTRHAVVDEKALVEAIKSKGIRAALDVFSNEPDFKEGAFSHALAEMPEVYLTHHIGASTMQAQEAIAEEAVRVILEFARSNRVENCVNMAGETAAVHQLMVRHVDRVGVLASVLGEISGEGWNVQEMENHIFSGAPAAVATIRFVGEVKKEVIERIQANSDILAVSVIDL